MRNLENVDLLRSGRDAVNAWRSENPGLVLDLTRLQLDGEDLSGLCLNGAILSGSSLCNTNLRGANLSYCELIGTRLNGADLRKADISAAKLDGAQFARANLTEANLEKANLVRTNLVGANLTRAQLTWSRLVSADLSDAILCGADLSRVDFSGALLARTNFREASCWGTIFADCDLTEAQGLEDVKHYAQSSLAPDTLWRPGRQIPLAFLRGCGIPEKLITYLPSLTGNAIEYYSCFISHSHEDKSFARRLHDALQVRGIRCWLDEHQMLPGDDIHEQVDRGIRLWDKTLLCASKHSLDSWWVDNEIETAFAKERRIMKERQQKVLALVPLDLDGYLFGSWQNGKAQQVKSRIAADFRGWESDNAIFEREFEKVVKSLHTDGTGREPPPVPKL